MAGGGAGVPAVRLGARCCGRGKVSISPISPPLTVAQPRRLASEICEICEIDAEIAEQKPQRCAGGRPA